MSEGVEFDEIFDGIRGAAPPVPFASAAAVRRRGRQRARRQAAVAAVAVLALAGVGSGGVVLALDAADGRPIATAPGHTGQPGALDATASPATASPATASPDPAAPELGISDAWPLTAEDLGQGWRPTSNELFESDPPWFWAELCPRYRSEDYSSLPRRVSLMTVSFHNQSLPGRVDQILERFEPGAADDNLRDVRVAATVCSARPDPADQVAPTNYDPIRTGFAGDESVLFLAEAYYFDQDGEIAPTAERQYVAVVQVGDVVSTTRYGGAIDLDRALQIAAAAAARLP